MVARNATGDTMSLLLSLLARVAKVAEVIRAANDAGRGVTDGELNELMSADDNSRDVYRKAVAESRKRTLEGEAIARPGETEAERAARVGHPAGVGMDRVETSAEKRVRETQETKK